MSIRIVACILVLLACSAHPSAAGVEGLSDQEALRLGEAIYRDGVLPSGKPVKASAQGDLVLSGSMVTCSNCHMRSGLGSYEGYVLTLPTNGAKLFSPLADSMDLPAVGMKHGILKYTRPAYTDETLATVLISGIDPTGRTISETMPRYELDDRDLKILAFYLKNLSAKSDPGVTAKEIRFATVVTDDVSPRDRAALIEPLKAYIKDEWNYPLPAFQKTVRDNVYLPAALDVWELKGPPDTWNEQLNAFYARRPVFALIGGISGRSWAPIHEFCEKNGIPDILPITDLPVLSDPDWYTLYFSKGLYQEGESAAEYLTRHFSLPPDKTVVQVYRDDERGATLSRGFAETWKKLGTAQLQKRVLSAREAVGKDFWKELAAAYENAVMLLWLEAGDLAGIESLAKLPGGPSLVIVSATMLGGIHQLDAAERPDKSGLSALPDAVRDVVFVTWPGRLPDEQKHIKGIVNTWLKIKKIPERDPELSIKVYFMTRVLANALLNMRGDFYRDYFLDLIDGLEDYFGATSDYPRLTFGPGQRFASKGCYLVTLTKGPRPKVVPQSDWIVY